MAFNSSSLYDFGSTVGPFSPDRFPGEISIAPIHSPNFQDSTTSLAEDEAKKKEKMKYALYAVAVVGLVLVLKN